jgi:hypothetical protein
LARQSPKILKQPRVVVKYRSMVENPEFALIANKKYKENIDTLASTEGFPKLNKRQQKIIRAFLAIQARVDRVRHPESSFVFFHEGADNPYASSYKHVRDLNCHGAISILEGNPLLLDVAERVDVTFFNAKYQEVPTIETAKRLVEGYNFPCVVHVGTECGNPGRVEKMEHSCLVFGHGPTGDIIIWEKQGFSYPYRVTTLAVVYGFYGSGMFWGVRMLKSSES